MIGLIWLLAYAGAIVLVISFLELLNWLDNRKKTDEDRRREALLEAFLELTRRDRRK